MFDNMNLTEIVNDTIYEYLDEATVERDKYFYDIANNFYERMIIELNDKNYIVQNDGNILFKASEINLNYKDLLILFTNVDKMKSKPTFGDNSFQAGYSFGTSHQYKVIVITNLKEDMNPSKGIRKDGFIHEFIHYLDFKRSNGYKPNYNEKTTIGDYFNSPREYNAYYQEAANYVVNLFNDENHLNKFREKFTTFNSFYDWMLNNVLDNEYVKHLNEKNRLKLKKRIYNIYSEYLQ